MRVIISAAVSSNGYMDDCSPERLVLSNKEDWQEVYALRAKCDAILVGAETVRKDNPALIIRDERLRAERIKQGLAADIAKVVVTASANLNSEMRFFTEGEHARKIVITSTNADEFKINPLKQSGAEIFRLDAISAANIKLLLSAAGIRTLMVEGGASIIKMFIDEDAVDELRLAISPTVVAQSNAPRLPYFDALPFENIADKELYHLGDMEIRHYIIHKQ